MAGFEVEGASKLLAVSTELKAIGDKKLQASMRKRLRAAAAPVVVAVKAAAAEHSVHIPKTIDLSMRYTGRMAGAYIVAHRNKMPKGHEALPGLFENGPFRHPVFGDKEVWVAQKGYPFMYSTGIKELPAIRAEMERILDDVAEGLL